MIKRVTLIVCITLVVSATIINTYASLKIQKSKSFISLLTLANLEALASSIEWPGEFDGEWWPGYDPDWWIGKDVPGLEGILERCTLYRPDGSFTSSVMWVCKITYDSPDNNCTSRPCGF